MLGLKDVARAIQNERHGIRRGEKEYEKNINKKKTPKTDNLISNGKVGVILAMF
jgi:hypothetical protein